MSYISSSEFDKLTDELDEDKYTVRSLSRYNGHELYVAEWEIYDEEKHEIILSSSNNNTLEDIEKLTTKSKQKMKDDCYICKALKEKRNICIR